MMQQIVIVIAGNSREFHQCMHEKIDAAPEGTKIEYRKNVHRCDIGNTSYRLASMPDQLRGLRGVKVEYYGTWERLPRERLALFREIARYAEMPR